MNEVGKPHAFPIDAWLAYVNGLIASDETLMALEALKMAPAYYLDHYPEEAKKIADELHRQMFTPIQYCGIYNAVPVEIDPSTKWPLRFELLSQKVKELNEKGITPHIMELAPGGGGTKYLMKARKQDFTYDSVSLDGVDRHGEPGETKTTIFVAFEIIEHLHNEWEIYQNYLKFRCKANMVMISTPLYTFMPMPDWRVHALGHLRTYSPKSFISIVSKMFEGFNWELFTDSTMILCGEKQ